MPAHVVPSEKLVATIHALEAGRERFIQAVPLNDREFVIVTEAKAVWREYRTVDPA